jgi:hypothetical protein
MRSQPCPALNYPSVDREYICIWELPGIFFAILFSHCVLLSTQLIIICTELRTMLDPLCTTSYNLQNNPAVEELLSTHFPGVAM